MQSPGPKTAEPAKREGVAGEICESEAWEGLVRREERQIQKAVNFSRGKHGAGFQ